MSLHAKCLALVAESARTLEGAGYVAGTAAFTSGRPLVGTSVGAAGRLLGSGARLTGAVFCERFRGR